jgi:hypothetical protein
MPYHLPLEQTERTELAQSVDDGRAAPDPINLSAALRTLMYLRIWRFASYGQESLLGTKATTIRRFPR